MPDGAVARIADLASRSRPRCGTIRVVAIDGPSGGGKTAMAMRVASRTGATVVHMDDIYPGWDGLADGVHLVVRDVLEPWARGDRAAYRQWNWSHDRPGPLVEVAPAPLVVLEGAGSSVGAAGDYASVRVWVEAAEAIRKARGIARDPGFEPHWERWAVQERKVFGADGTRERADLVVMTDRVDD
jgi:cytidylate kinase